MKRLLLTGALLMLGAGANAAPFTTTCDAGSACNGATYAILLANTGGNDYETTYVIDLDGLDIAATYIKAVSFKIGSFDFSAAGVNAHITDAPGGIAGWDLFIAGLNASGCSGGNTSEPCAQADSTLNGGKGYKLTDPASDGNQLIWRFAFTAPNLTIPDTVHIKYLFANADGKKVGSLGSWDIMVSDGGSGDGGGSSEGGSQEGGSSDGGGSDGSTQTPEPATLALFGLALAGGASRLRKRILK